MVGAAAPGWAGRWRAAWRAIREILLLSLLYVGYSAGRLLASDDADLARANASRILDVERWLRLAGERWLDHWLTGSTPVVVGAAYWYAVMHYLVTPVMLVVLWHVAPHVYQHARRALALACGVALVCYVAFPVMPPRLFGGYVDTMARTAPWGWWGAHASAPRGLGELTNEFAAMPSLHVGWAVWCAWAAAFVLRRRWQRWLAWLYPVVTSLVVIGTGNHWLLDVVAGACLVGAAVVLTRSWRRTGHPDVPLVVLRTSAPQGSAFKPEPPCSTGGG